MKKALIVTNVLTTFQYGLLSMIKPLEEQGYEVHLAANFSLFKDDLNAIPIKYFQIDFIRNPFNFKNICAYRQLNTLVKREKYSLIHCNSPVGGLIGRLVAHQRNIREIIYTAHGFHFYKGAPFINHIIYKPVEFILSRFTDKIITINEEDYQAAKKMRCHDKGNKYKISGVGIDVAKLKGAVYNTDYLYDELRMPRDATILLSVGELNHNKNNKVILKSLTRLNKDIHLILCGEGNDAERLKQFAIDNKIDDRVHFLGYRSDVAQILKISDIYIIASFREGLSRSVMEAMASCKPCIVSKIRGNVDLIIEGKGGFLFDPKDDIQLSRYIIKLYEEKELRYEMGIFNSNYIEDWSMAKVQEQMIEIYKS